MAKAKRERINPRGQVEVNVGVGGGNVPAAIRATAMGKPGPGALIGATGDWRTSGFGALSGTLNYLQRELSIREAEARADAREAARDAKAAAKEAAQEAKAHTAALDGILGARAAIEAQREIDTKSRAGEWTLEDANNFIMDKFSGESTAFIRAAQPFLLKSLERAEANTTGKTLAETDYFFRSETRQAFHDIHSTYDPDNLDGYTEARRAIYDARDSLGIHGSELNKMEMASLSSNVKRLASSDPLRAQALIDIAYQLRPDGSPSLAASLPTGYDELNTLQDFLNTTSFNANVTEAQLAADTLKESTRDNYTAARIALAKADTPEAVEQWEAEYIHNMDDRALKDRYGDLRADLVVAHENMRRGVKQEGNQAAVAEHSMGIQRGVANWNDINSDPRLNDIQKVQLFETMQRETQQIARGYVTDGQLAGMFLEDLERRWPQSIYGTPWNASRQMEPGKPPVVTAEGHYYQGELLKRLRQVEPNLDVVQSNTIKREIAQDVASEILSGKLRWADNKGSLNVPVPQLKLSEKVKANERLTDREVQALGKAFNQGGTHQISDGYGLDYYALDPNDQRRVAGEAQRQKAELEALNQQTWSYRLFGDPDSKVEALEWERQQNEEAARLALEGLDVDRKVALGLPVVDLEAATDAMELLDVPEIPLEEPKALPPVEPPGILGDFVGNIGNVYGSQMMITP